MDKNAIKFKGCIFFLSSVKHTSRWAKKDNIPGVSVLDLDGVIVLHADSALLKVHFVLLFYISGFLPFPLPTEDLFESPSLILFF